VTVGDARKVADRSIAPWVERGLVVGVVVGLCRGDELWVKSYGTSGTSRPLDGHTMLEIGSITKTFTGLLLADMSVRGEVRLEDPIGRFLPFEPPRGPGREITLLDLATHTARLPRSGRILILQSLRNRREPFVSFTEQDLYATVAGARIRRGLGTKMAYSNLGFGLLGHILSRVSGRPYDQLVDERVCRPLGLSDTGVTADGAAPGRVARGHRRGGRPAPPLRIPTLAGAGALRSTTADMLAYLWAHLHPEGTPMEEPVRLAVGPHRTFRKGKVAVGLGWLHGRRGHRSFVWHNGGTVGFGSFAAFAPDRGTGVVLLSNSRYLLRSGRAGLALLEALGA
jgi:serine-type D-Ala-D-Ala carboxypeptidase/endopeptidase